MDEIVKKSKKEIIMPIDVIDYLFLTDSLLTNVKTQKIIYFFFKDAFKHKLLNINDYEGKNECIFQAWMNGPVNYHAYKRYFELKNDIEFEDIEMKNIFFKNRKRNEYTKLTKLLTEIFFKVKDMSRASTIEISHDVAWKNARESIEDGYPSKKPLINEDIINSDFFIENFEIGE